MKNNSTFIYILLGILNLVSLNLLCQKEYYADHWPTTTMEYFTNTIINPDSTFIDVQELEEIITQTYIKRELISLNNMPKSKWPYKAKLFPYQILNLEAIITKREVNNSEVIQIEFREVSYNKTIIKSQTHDITARNKRAVKN